MTTPESEINSSEGFELSALQAISGDHNQAIDRVDGYSKVVGNATNVYFQEITVQAAERVTSRFQLPPAPSDFTGRREELAQITATLTRQADTVAVAISAVAGMAGVGKSALAIQAAHALKAQFPDAQLYVNLQGADAQPRAASDVLGEWLRALGLEGSEIPADLRARTKAFRSQLAVKRALVVLDNAHDEAQVRPLLPGGSGCAVLVTSRKSLAALAGTQILRLQTLPAIDGLALLTKLVGEGRVAAEQGAAQEIVALCGDLPLAIRIAGGVLKGKAHWSLAADYLPLLRDERQRLGQLVQSGGEDVRASFNLSCWQLDIVERSLFAMLGVLPNEFGIQVAATVGAIDVAIIRSSLETLIEAQLVEVAERGRYRYHDLMRVYAKDLLDDSTVLIAEKRVFEWYYQGANYFEYAFSPERRRQLVAQQKNGVVDKEAEESFLQTALDWFELERVNLLAAFNWGFAAGKYQEVVSFATNLVSFFNARSYWQDWEGTYMKALSAARASKNLADEGVTRAELGVVYQFQGRWDEAISQYEQSLGISRSVGDRHGEGVTRTKLGNVYRFQGRWDEAISQYEQSLEISRSVGDRHGEGVTRANLGIVYRYQGRWDEAISQYEQSLEIKRSMGDRHGEGIARANLGSVHQFQGRWDEAISQYEQSLEIKRSMGDRHGEGQTRMGLGSVYQFQGRWDEAISQYEQSLEICRSVGDRHGEGQTRMGLGIVYKSQGRWDEAISQYEQSLEIFRSVGDRHGEGTTLGNLGSVYQSQGRWDDAISQYEQSLEIKRSLGDRHGEGQTLMNLGYLYAARVQYDKAIEYWQSAQAKLHPDSPEAQQIAQQLKNPYPIKQMLAGWLIILAILAFVGFNLLRGHWLIAALSLIAWASFATYNLWKLRRGKREQR